MPIPKKCIKQFKSKSWCANLQPDSLLSAKEVVELFGFKTIVSLHEAHFHGRFPKPDVYWQIGTSKTETGHGWRAYWRYKTILAEAKRRERLLEDGENETPMEKNNAHQGV